MGIRDYERYVVRIDLDGGNEFRKCFKEYQDAVDYRRKIIDKISEIGVHDAFLWLEDEDCINVSKIIRIKLVDMGPYDEMMCCIMPYNQTTLTEYFDPTDASMGCRTVTEESTDE